VHIHTTRRAEDCIDMLPTRTASSFHALVHDLKMARLARAGVCLPTRQKTMLSAVAPKQTVGESKLLNTVDESKSLPTPTASPFHTVVYERKLARLRAANRLEEEESMPAHDSSFLDHALLPTPSASPFHAAVFERKAKRQLRALQKEMEAAATALSAENDLPIVTEPSATVNRGVIQTETLDLSMHTAPPNGSAGLAASLGITRPPTPSFGKRLAR